MSDVEGYISLLNEDEAILWTGRPDITILSERPVLRGQIVCAVLGLGGIILGLPQVSELSTFDAEIGGRLSFVILANWVFMLMLIVGGIYLLWISTVENMKLRSQSVRLLYLLTNKRAVVIDQTTRAIKHEWLLKLAEPTLREPSTILFLTLGFWQKPISSGFVLVKDASLVWRTAHNVWTGHQQ